MHEPASLEEAPLRRQDRRALNALRRRRADKKLIACLFCTILSLAIATIVIVVAWFTWKDTMSVNPFKLLAAVVGVISVMLVLTSLEICHRLVVQSKRVKDRNLLRTKNLHEKHFELNLTRF